MRTSATALALVLAAAANSLAGAITYTVTSLGDLPGSVYAPVNEWNGLPHAAPQVGNSGVVGAGQGTLQDGPNQVQSDGRMFHYSGPGTPETTVPPAGGNLSSNSTENQSLATGVNASGTAVGFQGYFDPQAFTYRAGGPTTPGQSPGVSLIPGLVPGTSAWYALGINSAGDVVGQTPAAATPAYELTQHGDLIGLWNPSQHAYLYDGTASVDLNTLIAPGSGWLLTAATSINDLGQIAGYGDYEGVSQAFLLTPTATPEPGTLFTVLAGIGGLLLRRAAGWQG